MEHPARSLYLVFMAEVVRGGAEFPFTGGQRLDARVSGGGRFSRFLPAKQVPLQVPAIFRAGHPIGIVGIVGVEAHRFLHEMTAWWVDRDATAAVAPVDHVVFSG